MKENFDDKSRNNLNNVEIFAINCKKNVEEKGNRKITNEINFPTTTINYFAYDCVRLSNLQD